MGHFDHEKLDEYQAGIEFVAKADDIVEQLPRGRAYLADQLQRAATSVPLNALRLRLLKIGVRVLGSARRIWFGCRSHRDGSVRAA